MYAVTLGNLTSFVRRVAAKPTNSISATDKIMDAVGERDANISCILFKAAPFLKTTDEAPKARPVHFMMIYAQIVLIPAPNAKRMNRFEHISVGIES